MKEVHKEFLNLLFDKEETICVSDCAGGYHSISQDDLLGDITLVSPKVEKLDRTIKASDINLVAINPINGFRRDKEVTAFRTFLMELDEGSLSEQKKYMDTMEVPYSICIFSGNKSLHYGIVLDKPLANKAIWSQINLWILNILKQADQQCKNPSRSIRFPGNIRKNGLKKEQKLIEIKKRVTKQELYEWLNRYPECKPKKEEKLLRRERTNYLPPDTSDIPEWVKEKIDEGVAFERNSTFHRMALSLFGKGFEPDQVKNILMLGVVDDFPESEMDTLINSAFKRIGE